MKNILKNVILTFAISVLFIGTANAATIKVGNGKALSSSNGQVTIELQNSKSDLSEYTKVEFKLEVQDTSYASITSLSARQGTGLTVNTTQENNSIVYSVSKDSGLIEATIGDISYRTEKDLSGNFKIRPYDVTFYKSDGTKVETPNSSIEIVEGNISYEKPKSSEANITNLTVSQGTLSPEFNPTVKDYTVKVKDTINSLRIGAEVSPGATRTGTGTKPLSMGENNVEIVVTAEDGVTKNTYNITIIRGEIAEPSAYLKSLDVNNIGIALTPEFDSKNDKYTVTVGTDIKKLEFKYETEDPLAKVEIDGNDEFKVGENEVVIKVTSSDEAKTQEYKVTVIVEEEESTAPIVEDEIVKKKGPNVWLIVIIVVVALLIIAGVIFLLFRKNKKKKGSNDKDNNGSLPKTNTIKTIESSIDEDKDPTSITEMLGSDDEETMSDEESTIEDTFTDDRTQRFDEKLFKNYDEYYNDDVEKTKEFDFSDLQ